MDVPCFFLAAILYSIQDSSKEEAGKAKESAQSLVSRPEIG
jgi:hypothetical protein